MRICGLQTLSLVDYPGKLATTVFTGGCNLRCPFCHNALLVNRLEENRETHPYPRFWISSVPAVDCWTGW